MTRIYVDTRNEGWQLACHLKMLGFSIAEIVPLHEDKHESAGPSVDETYSDEDQSPHDESQGLIQFGSNILCTQSEQSDPPECEEVARLWRLWRLCPQCSPACKTRS